MLVLPAVLQDSDFQHCALIAVCCDQLGAVMAYFETLLKNKKKKSKKPQKMKFIIIVIQYAILTYCLPVLEIKLIPICLIIEISLIFVYTVVYKFVSAKVP